MYLTTPVVEHKMKTIALDAPESFGQSTLSLRKRKEVQAVLLLGARGLEPSIFASQGRRCDSGSRGYLTNIAAAQSACDRSFEACSRK